MNAQAMTGILYSNGIYNPLWHAKELGADVLYPRIYKRKYPGLAAEAREYNKKILVRK